jgi:hypothetical protein
MRFDPFREVDRLTEAMLERTYASNGHGRLPPRQLAPGHFDLPVIHPASIDLTVE